MTEFYVLEPDGGLFGIKWAYAENIEPVILGEVSDRCPICNRGIGLKPWLPPYKAKLSSAKPEKWGDFLWIGGTSLAVSKRIMDLYFQEELSGIKSFTGPIEIVRYGTRKTGDVPIIPPEYYVIRVPWGGANQDDIASGVNHERPEAIKCNYCRVGWSKRTQPRIIIEKNSWNGEDIFRPRGSFVQEMVSDKFKKILEKNNATNIKLIPENRYGYDEKRHPNRYINEE